jgi:hypothetical protein
LEVTLHDGHGGPLTWSTSAHADLSLLFRDIAADTQNSVLVITGAGGQTLDKGTEAVKLQDIECLFRRDVKARPGRRKVSIA